MEYALSQGFVNMLLTWQGNIFEICNVKVTKIKLCETVNMLPLDLLIECSSRLYRINDPYTKVIQKVKNVCAYSRRTCFVAADYWFVFSVMLSCLMQLHIGPYRVVSAEIAVAMAVPIENPADCEVRGVIRFLQADEILGYLAEEASSRMKLFCCTTIHVRILPGRNKPC